MASQNDLIVIVECGVCGSRIPKALANQHHKIPVWTGGPDTPDNLIWLDPTCHHSLHRLAECYQRRDVASATHLAQQLFPKHSEPRARLIALSKVAAKAAAQIQKPAEDKVTITVSVSTEVYAQLKQKAGRLRQAGKRATVPALCRMVLSRYVNGRKRKELPEFD